MANWAATLTRNAKKEKGWVLLLDRFKSVEMAQSMKWGKGEPYCYDIKVHIPEAGLPTITVNAYDPNADFDVKITKADWGG